MPSLGQITREMAKLKQAVDAMRCLCHGGGPVVVELVSERGEPIGDAPTVEECPVPSHKRDVLIVAITKYTRGLDALPARAIETYEGNKATESAPPVLDIRAHQPEPLRAPEPPPAPAVPARTAILTLERTYRERPTLQLPGGFCRCGDHRLYHGPVYDGQGALLPEGQNAGRCGARDCTCEAFQPATQATTERKERP